MTRKLTRKYSFSVVLPFVAIIIVLTGEASVSPPPVFLPHVIYDTGGSQYSVASSVAIADLNGDGKPDLVVTNALADSGTVGVLLANGDGTFRFPVAYGTGGAGPTWVAVADVNGDGKPDLIVTNSNQCCPISCADGTVSVLLGNGDGTFQTAVSYDAGASRADSVAVADVNGDGKPDLIVTTFYPGCVGVLLGNGGGTFQPVVTNCAEPLANFLAVAVGDFNGDGKPDLVVTTNDNVFVFLNKGDGTFLHTRTYGIGGGYDHSVAVADVNLDGKLDLVVANSSGADNLPNTVGVLLGNGDGTFRLGEVLNSGGYAEVAAVAVADVSGDGRPDIMVANLCYSTSCTSGSGGLGLLLGHGDGTFSLAEKYPILTPGGSSTIAVADMNGDGWPDLAVGGYNGNGIGLVSVLLNTAGHVPSTTAMSTSGTPSLVGQPVTFTATGTSKYGTIPNGESVTFYDGTTAIGTGTTAGGMASFTTSSLTGTTHHIKGTYAGDATFEPSSGLVNQVVDKYSTTTTLNSSVNPSNYGQAVTLTAKVTSAGPAPTGTVTFKNGSVSLGYGTLNASGVATWNTAKIPVGANTLTSTYNGDAFNAKSVLAGITQTVRQASIHVVLTSTPNPSTLGKSVHFTATLTSNGSLPTGQPVTFSYNGAILGTVNVSSTGVAIFSTTSLPRGSDVVTAAYAGSVDYSSASAIVTQVVN
jgi:hypothetical protein